ncbi:hypothetical protein Poly30_46480 [Planctomycetes bacterium Poly30]|uniref:Uncharacterized protein n=1 Tax=Saltatorellus ferox TaxID=2528018 RepID=A0A518EYD0_9BACT|nr:hypothetical protein Poly30_46480 [Planctomycetes bacterium Poly30]
MSKSQSSESPSGASEGALPPLHRSDETSLDESYRQREREAASKDPATKFGSWRDGREGDGTRFPEEVDMRPDDRSHQRSTGANATPGSEAHPISPSEFPGGSPEELPDESPPENPGKPKA